MLPNSSMREYYHSGFRDDLARFLADTSVPYFGHAWKQSCKQLERVDSSHRAKFLICLYFTVLCDQAMHAHFRSDYSRFAELTRYPKFCYGLGQFHLNPRDILVIPVEQGIVDADETRTLLPDGMRLFVDEAIDFLTKYFPHIQPKAFFQKLMYDPDVQIPLLVVELNSDIRNDVVWIAYSAMRQAAEERFPSESC